MFDQHGNYAQFISRADLPKFAAKRPDQGTEQEMKAVVDEAYRTGDTAGGIFEVVARGLPAGLGSYITWDSRLDGRLAQAIVSMRSLLDEKVKELHQQLDSLESYITADGIGG